MLMTVALGVPAMAAQGSVIERANYDVFKDVSSQVNRYVNFTVFDDVSASVVDGVVTLDGRVTMPYKRQDLERRVSKIAGVRAVQNKIEVLPVSRYSTTSCATGSRGPSTATRRSGITPRWPTRRSTSSWSAVR